MQTSGFWQKKIVVKICVLKKSNSTTQYQGKQFKLLFLLGRILKKVASYEATQDGLPLIALIEALYFL